MNSELWLLITIIRKEDMELLRYVHKTDRNTNLGQNYMYWREDDIVKIYVELFDFDEEVVILKVEEIEGMK